MMNNDLPPLNKRRIYYGLSCLLGLNIGVYFGFGWGTPMMKGVLVTTLIGLFIVFYPYISKKYKLPF